MDQRKMLDHEHFLCAHQCNQWHKHTLNKWNDLESITQPLYGSRQKCKKKKRKEGTPELEEKKGPHKKKLKTKSTIRKRV